MANLHIQVNERVVDWDDEDDSRQARSCEGCGGPTKGRADLDSPTRNFANMPYCMACAMNVGFGK